MQQGDVQIYDKPAPSVWKRPVFWVILLSLMVGLGVYLIPSLG